MATRSSYLPHYSASRALIIGINKYRHVSPLVHARDDAESVAEVLNSRFGFPPDHIDVLLDERATRHEIMKTLLGYSDTSRVDIDDRILVFFAGHGHTFSSHRGEIGFLVPVDGNIDDLSTLIRWDDLTRNADLIPAKHMLFLMDACYGGLALTRTTIPPGSMRFLKDMLQRFSRQVLTAGKADEVVADAGGSRSDHSIFTSHLLDGLEGAAVGPSGILTGYGLMAYVYDKVGKDIHSRQTPHFGFFDGDGDFIFDTSHLAKLNKTGVDPGVELDELIQSPFLSSQQSEDLPSALKRLIADPSQKISLSDYIFSLIRKAGNQLQKENFPTSATPSKEEFVSRVQRYEEAIDDLLVSVILLSAWGTSEQINLITKILERVSEFEKPQAGAVIWIKLNWYPELLLMYATGISALANRRFDVLYTALCAEVWMPRSLLHRDYAPIVLPVGWEMVEIVDRFKWLPGMEQRYFARSDHIHKRLQPILEDQLFLGKSYESLFDTFEIFFALTFADVRGDDAMSVWGPPGRFMLKERGMLSNERPYAQFVEKAKASGDQWEPLKAGFFQTSSQRFATLVDGYAQRMSGVNL
jgi:Caspase domain